MLDPDFAPPATTGREGDLSDPGAGASYLEQFSLPAGTTARNGPAGAFAPTLSITYNRLPTAAVPSFPAEGAVLVSDGPTLTVSPATDPDPTDTVLYWFRVGTGPNVEGGHGIDSGWLTTPSWTMPTGVLADGTYRWFAFTSDGVNPSSFTVPPAATTRSFRSTLRLGAGGPAPADTVGPVRANLASGNVVAAHASPQFPTVGGSVGVGFAYNSAARVNGLVGDYYANPGTGAFPTTPPTMTRRDPNVAFYWGADSPPSPTVASANFMVRWTGNLTTPADAPANTDYTFYVATQGGVRMWVDNVLRMDNWLDSGAGSRADIATAVTLGPGVTVPIRFEYLESTGEASLALAVTGSFGPGGAVENVIVPASWFTAPALGPLAAGWTLSGGGALGYTSAHVFEHGATLTDAAGGLHTYRANPSGGYTPPLDEDGVLARDADGLLSLTATDGVTYVFDGSGRLTATSAATDDDTKATADYTWSTDPAKVPRLLRITDPVGQRQLRLDYGGYDAARPCPAVPAGQNLVAAPADKLCQVENWDGTFTRIWYNAAGQLVRISEDPSASTLDPMASVTDYAYDVERRLAKVRDPLANDAVKATAVTFVPDDDTSRTLITYDPVGRVKDVTLPMPYDGLSATARPRPGRDYDYRPVNPADPSHLETWVHVDGLTGATDEPAGYHRKVIYDLAGRLSTDADATARSTTATWDAGDRLATRTDGAGRSTTTVYDGDFARAQPTGRVTDTYGPAPYTCFASTGIPNGSCTAVPPPHTGIDFDTESATPVTGLAMTAWANTGWRGEPKLRSQAAPSGAGALVAADPAGLPAGAWSARYSGEITLAAPGDYGFALNATGTARLYIDDTLVADSTVGGGSGTWTNAFAGRHRIRIDFAAVASPGLTLSWTPPGASSQALGATVLAPRFANPTTTTTDDDSAVAARVTSAVYESMPRGTVKEEIVDPGGLNLVTTTAYETGGLGRPVSRTLPAGDAANPSTATTYAYYGDTEGSPAVCGRAGGVNQAGRLRTTTGPSPDGTSAGRRVSEVVYDVAGRVVASRVNAEDWSCRSYDPRGRLSQSTIPAYGGEGGHIVDYNYAVGTNPNPLVTSMAEAAAVIITRVDLLGRVLSYRDVWANVTTSTYDQAGRRTATAGPAGINEATYDPAGRVMTQKLDGAVMATAAYHATTGELDSVSYAGALNGGNGTKLAAIGRHASGMTNALSWQTTAGGAIAADVVERSQSGKVIDQSIDGTDAGAGAANFVYDASGRLTQARVPGQVLDYAFATTGGCGTQTAPGRNANRSSVVLNGATPTTYCYDLADKLTSSSDAAVGTPAYDAHGNTTTLGTQTLIYDGADQHMATEVGGTTLVRYQRDATGRITSRTEGTAAAVRYGFTGGGDSPGFVMDAANNVTERTVGLIGGVMVTKRGGLLGVGDVWSYPNVHGDVMAVADHTGAKQGPTRTYDPFGQALAGLPDNSAGNLDYGWLGSHQRPIEHAGALATIEMGARQYVPSIGRFLEVDPVEGGSCNDYEYTCGDPVNGVDLDGRDAGPAQAAWCIEYGSAACGIAAWASRRAIAAGSNIAQRYNDVQLGNAVRHAYWLGLVAYWVGPTAAYRLGVAHELDNGTSGAAVDTIGDLQADLHNNLVGIRHGAQATLPGSIYGGVIRSLRRGELQCVYGGAISSCRIHPGWA